MAEPRDVQEERARQSRLHDLPYDEVGPSGPLKSVEGSIDDLIERQKAQQQEAYDQRVEHARSQGDLVEYRETVIAGKAYAWVGYKGDKLRLLSLAPEGITRPT